GVEARPDPFGGCRVGRALDASEPEGGGEQLLDPADQRDLLGVTQSQRREAGLGVGEQIDLAGQPPQHQGVQPRGHRAPALPAPRSPSTNASRSPSSRRSWSSGSSGQRNNCAAVPIAAPKAIMAKRQSPM